MLDGVEHLLGRLRLANNAKIVLDRQHFGHASAKDRLMVRNDNVDHT